MENIYEFLDKNSYYVILVITMIIWLGMYLFINNIDNQINKIEKTKGH